MTLIEPVAIEEADEKHQHCLFYMDTLFSACLVQMLCCLFMAILTLQIQL